MWKRWLWIVALTVLVAAASIFALRPRPVEVEIARALRAPLRVSVEEEGKTRIRDRFVVSSPVAGFVRRMPWKEGNTVRAGDTAAVLEPLRAEVLDPRARDLNEARLRAAEAAARIADARLSAAEQQARAAAADAEYWRGQLEREQKLASSGDIPAERLARTRSEAARTEAALRAAQDSAAAARAEVEQARAGVQAARAALTNPTVSGQRPTADLVHVRWPVSGRVLRVVKASEGVVQAGEALVELGDVRALEVTVEVLSVDAVKMKPGTRVEFIRWGGDQPLQGAVRVIEPAGFTKVSALGVEEQRVRVIADITSPEPEWRRLGEGYRVDAVFILWEGSSVLQVPASALFRNGEEWTLFTVENGIARRRAVRVGRRNGSAAEITEGLAEGAQVIAHPDENVAEGKKVVARS
jgi:HlyD family secretion protein